VKQKLLILITALLLLSVAMENFRGFFAPEKESIELSQENDKEEKDIKDEKQELPDAKIRPVFFCFLAGPMSAKISQYACYSLLFLSGRYTTLPEMPPEPNC
jgi:hypothetical protein